MEKLNALVDIHYKRNGSSSTNNALGMREMQANVYAACNNRFLLIKAPPASGKSRALMFVALDKLYNQGIKKLLLQYQRKVLVALSTIPTLQKTDFLQTGQPELKKHSLNTNWLELTPAVEPLSVLPSPVAFHPKS